MEIILYFLALPIAGYTVVRVSEKRYPHQAFKRWQLWTAIALWPIVALGAWVVVIVEFVRVLRGWQ